jgi:hypothetical protein
MKSYRWDMDIIIINSRLVCGGAPYMLGLSFGGDQIRIGLIWWHIVIYLSDV